MVKIISAFVKKITPQVKKIFKFLTGNNNNDKKMARRKARKRIILDKYGGEVDIEKYSRVKLRFTTLANELLNTIEFGVMNDEFYKRLIGFITSSSFNLSDQDFVNLFGDIMSSLYRFTIYSDNEDYIIEKNKMSCSFSIFSDQLLHRLEDLDVNFDEIISKFLEYYYTSMLKFHNHIYYKNKRKPTYDEIKPFLYEFKTYYHLIALANASHTERIVSLIQHLANKCVITDKKIISYFNHVIETGFAYKYVSHLPKYLDPYENKQMCQDDIFWMLQNCAQNNRRPNIPEYILIPRIVSSSSPHSHDGDFELFKKVMGEKLLAKNLPIDNIQLVIKLKMQLTYLRHSSDKDCAICCVKNLNRITFIPCGHCNVCEPCYSKLVKNECPFCRIAITEIIRLKDL